MDRPTAEIHKPPQHARLSLRALRLFHPFPTLLNVAATAGLACVAAGGVPDLSLLIRMMLVMLAAQSSIGAANDYFDRELDAASKPWKPIVAGLVSPEAAAVLAVTLGAAALALAATLGAGALGLAALGLLCGLAYDARLKRTAFSAVPLMIAIPTLPLFVWAASGEWDPVLWWLLPIGALLGLSLHLANTVPDIESDAAHGVSGLAHRLGVQASMWMSVGSFAVAIVSAVLLAPFVDYEAWTFVPALAVAVIALLVAVVVLAARPRGIWMQAGFGGLAIGTAVLAIGWLAAVT